MKQFKEMIALICLLALGLFAFWAYNHYAVPIRKIKSFSQVNFNDITADSLVIFDADETLIQPIDTYYINEFTGQAIGFKKEFMAQHPEISDWDLYADITIKEVQRPLIEP